MSIRNSDSFGSSRQLLLQSQQLRTILEQFAEDHSNTLSTQSISTIQLFLEETRELITATLSNSNSNFERMKAAIVKFAAFEAELSFILADVQEAVRVRSERAFSHLQRSIVADEDIQNKWIAAFGAGEEKCEKLGSVHLLSHEIWAFKAHASGGRTDLVFQDKVEDAREEQGYADGLVLTEWKVARDGDIAEEKFKEARAQAKDYAQGVLGGSELAGYRYAVVVSRKQIAVPGDLTVDKVVWRHINIAVEPDVPSVASKKAKM